jgi:hypothetical protein
MTDPGWDVPGVPRDACPGAAAPDEAGNSASCASASVPTEAGSRGRRRKSERTARAGSISACAGLSAGAFAPLGNATAPAASSPGGRGDGSRRATTSAVTANSAMDIHSASASTSEHGGTYPVGPETDATALPAAASVTTASANAHGSGTAQAGTDARVGSPDVQVTDPAQALRLLSATLDFLAHANPAEWAEGQQADCLRALAVAESQSAQRDGCRTG